MEPGYFRSREFMVAGTIALVVLVTVPSAAFLIDDLDPIFGGSRCTVDTSRLSADPQIDTGSLVEGGRTERRIEYSFAVEADTLERVDLCSRVGTLRVLPHENDTLELIITPAMRGDHADTVDAVRPFVHYDGAPEGGRLTVAVGQTPRASTLFHEHSGSVSVELRIPAHMTITALFLKGDVGDRVVEGITVGHLHAVADVGKVRLDHMNITGDAFFRLDVGDVMGSRLSILGDVDARIDVGNIELAVDPVGNATWRFQTDVGDVFLEVPGDERYGYRVDIKTDIGSARADVGAEGAFDVRAGPRSALIAETEGFDDREVRLVISIRTDVGSGTIDAR